MQFVVKYFPEITIKSRPVRKQMCRQLQTNLRRLLKPIDASVQVDAAWDHLRVSSKLEDAARQQRLVAILQQTPGIAHCLEVVEYPLGDIADIADRVAALWGPQLQSKTFVVRCKRSGQHAFRSGDVEREVGAFLFHGFASAGVDLRHPQVTVRLEIRGDRLYVVSRRLDGLGGFPLGSIDSVLSLVSGGFDSTVASYQMMRRGMQTHFLFFNLGGHAHELGVKEVCLYLWMKYGASHPVKFVSVPFEPVVAEILQRVDDSHMGVVLKRMMLRVAGDVARQLNIQALVTGESVAQVSSQTLHNLAVIDQVTESLVLRPLICSHKADIVATSRAIGTEEFAAHMPEYCGVISVKPKTRAKLDRVEAEENKFDFAVLEGVVAEARVESIDDICLADEVAPDIEILVVPLADSVIIDLRHPREEEVCPLRLSGIEVLTIPFYQLHSRFAELDPARRYMLYCDEGVMSRLHAAHLMREGYGNVCVYRPD